jgi:penicillin-insensitive murein endopeptidase
MKVFFFLSLLVLSFQNIKASEAIGLYSSGKLRNAENILDKNILLHKLFMARQKFFTTRQMVDVIEDTSAFVRQTFPDSELIQLGDLSNKDGGKCPGHASHQNGLDADLVYLTHNKKLQSPNATYWEEDFVKNGVVSANLHVEKNFELFKYLVHNHPVTRIFVDQAIKKKMCQFAKSKKLLNDKETIETLRRLRVEKLHSTHYHVRLQCPSEDTACVNQAEVPNGSGC